MYVCALTAFNLISTWNGANKYGGQGRWRNKNGGIGWKPLATYCYGRTALSTRSSSVQRNGEKKFDRTFRGKDNDGRSNASVVRAPCLGHVRITRNATDGSSEFNQSVTLFAARYVRWIHVAALGLSGGGGISIIIDSDPVLKRNRHVRFAWLLRV